MVFSKKKNVTMKFNNVITMKFNNPNYSNYETQDQYEFKNK